jgi:FKBP-type peptidyl-prolyl cis-trans isomerase
MKRILLSLYLTVATVAAFTSCAENTELDLSEFENAAFDRWMKKYHPGIERLESGLYIEWIERNPDGRRLTEGNFMSIDYTARDQNGDYFLSRNKSIARQVGGYLPATHYAPEFTAYSPSTALSGGGASYYYDPYYYGGYGGYDDYYGSSYGYPYYSGVTTSTSETTTSGYPVGVWQALGMMHEGDSVRLYIPPAMGYYNGFNNNDDAYGYSPYGTSVSNTQGILFDLRLDEVVSDPLMRERGLVERYAADSLGIASVADSIALGTYLKKIVENPSGEPITADSLVTVLYTGRYLDGHIFDTNDPASAVEAFGVYDPNAVKEDGSSRWAGMEFNPNGTSTVTGFAYATKKMRNGEKARVVMVSGQAYGAEGSTDEDTGRVIIPPYTPLVFDIQVTAVGASTAD